MTERELNLRVHREVMRAAVPSWHLESADGNTQIGFELTRSEAEDALARNAHRGPPLAIVAEVPDYAGSIADAWRVVAEIQRRFPGWRFSLLGGDTSYGYWYPGGIGTDAMVDKSRREVFGWRASFFG